MLCRETGKIVHIDFGDCFEVAMMREKYPEKVPFRLTRMLVAAMEVTGIDGVYRHTCETMVQLMRDNRNSLLAVLEAFIHDPLLQWVLLENKRPALAPANIAPAIGAPASLAPNSALVTQNQPSRGLPSQQAQVQQQPLPRVRHLVLFSIAGLFRTSVFRSLQPLGKRPNRILMMIRNTA